jgi:hypothetical protein
MLIRVKDVPVGHIHDFGNGVYQAHLVNWSTGERTYIGDFGDFFAARKAILKARRKAK